MPEIADGSGFIAWAVAVVAAAYARPQLARTLLSVLFVLMGIVNGVTAVADPTAYQDAYADDAVLPFYRDILAGFWSRNDVALIGLIAALQVVLGAAVLVPGWARRWGLAGMVLFLLAVTPTHPTNMVNLVFAVGAVLVLRADLVERRAVRPSGEDVAAVGADDAPPPIAAEAFPTHGVSPSDVRGVAGIVRQGTALEVVPSRVQGPVVFAGSGPGQTRGIPVAPGPGPVAGGGSVLTMADATAPRGR
jgi:hypothetical protein